jgi:hypothetical protein
MTSQLPDAVIGPNEVSFLLGAVAHPVEGNDLYAYYGEDRSHANSWTVARTQGRWGNPNFINNGCVNQNLTGGTLGTFNTPDAGLTCTFDVQKAQEFTIGFWQDLNGIPGRTDRAGHAECRADPRQQHRLRVASLLPVQLTSKACRRALASLLRGDARGSAHV